MTLFSVSGGAVVGTIVGRAGLIDSGEVDTMRTSLGSFDGWAVLF